MYNANILGQLLLMQSILINLPDRETIFSFICRGLKDIPGVDKVTYSLHPEENSSKDILIFNLKRGQNSFGEVQLKISNTDSFNPYHDYLKNFMFMIEVVLEEKAQTEANKLHKIELENRVEERTKQLTQEIEDRKLIEKELQIAKEIVEENEKKYRKLITLAQEGIWVINKHNTTSFVNPSMAKMLGYSADEMLGKSLFDFMDETGIKIANKNLERRQAGIKEQHDFEFICKNGNRIVTSLEAAPIMDKSGNYEGSIAGVMNITERKKAEEELLKAKEKAEESEKSYISLFNSVSEAIYIQNKDGVFIDVNYGTYKMYGYTREEIIGKTPEMLAAPNKNDMSHALSLVKKVFETGNPEQYEFWGIRKNGEIFPKEVITSKVKYFGKDAIITTTRDITERKKAENELIIAREKAEESDRLKSAFLTNMSHEIRTPMNGILGFAALLEKPNLTPEAQHRFIKTINISGERMLSTINDIVDISRIESGMMSVNITEIDLNEKLKNLYNFFKPEVEQKGLIFSLNNSLSHQEASVKTDNEKVEAIFTNLIKNAVKFTSQGSIEFGCEKKGKHFEFYVKDTGEGIPENKKEIIFDRFRQVNESITRNYEGSGLGLSISKNYVEMLGGEIWLESEEGKGSIFYFTIPYIDVLEEKAEVKNIVSKEHKEGQKKSLKILIVEDDETSYSFLIEILQEISSEITHSLNGIEAVDACRNNPDLDLVLMDIRMAEMNGLEATQQIRQFNKDVIIIAQTAYGFSNDAEKALEAGCNDYISKPINIDMLYKLIQKHCS